MINIEIIGLEDYNLYKSITICNEVLKENQLTAAIKKTIINDPDIHELGIYPLIKIDESDFKIGEIPNKLDLKKKFEEILKEYFY